MQTRIKKSNFLLILIVILGFTLRSIWLDKYPPSLHADEVSTAYNAYSILNTAKDEHGYLLPVSLRAFGEWKSALDAYLMIPFIYIFGLKDFAVRLPSSILGSLSILLSYILVVEIFSGSKQKRSFALLSSFFLAISPWHLHLSRYAIHIIPSLFLLILGIIFFIKGLKNNKLIVFSFITFAISIYAYFSMRVIIPLLILFLIFKYIAQIKDKKWFVLAIISGFIFTLPMILAFFNEPKILLGRPKSVSVFFDNGTRLRIWKLQTEDGVAGIQAKISRLFHNKPYLYSKEIVQRYFSHLNPTYLFLEGDRAAPFIIPNMGILYLVDAFFIIAGFTLLIKKQKYSYFVVAILLMSILPAAFTYQTPSQNRTFNVVIIYMILVAYGVIEILKRFQRLPILKISIVVVYIISFNIYLRNYYIILPKEYAREWNYGFKELNLYLNSQKDNFQTITFLPNTGMSYIYMLYLNQYSPDLYFQEAVHDYRLDEVGFEHVEKFGKYLFPQIKKPWNEIKSVVKKGEIYIGREDEISIEDARHEIYYPNGKVAFRIVYL